MWLFAILVVLALGGVAVIAAGRGTPMSRAHDDALDALVPHEGPVTADDLRRIRFPLAFRGYRMGEVDALLDRLAEERERPEQARPAAESPDRPDLPHRPGRASVPGAGEDAAG
ncbi:MAG TPA: DivIVA domain-containing protein [Nocardioides sp.]|jgi:DivIVA domain-containing protein|uniref:DivIVA domain-containing protein n=1 Tax=Nocardioides sp. TaxID=35761 RepID=UPI002E3687C3|nr:DivIVA domain-containing protein [Nocardioides sp.]HEX3932902.1 DivIVA domain-containing protein [Nocardioides sp.]